jgi:hypothetical protein
LASYCVKREPVAGVSPAAADSSHSASVAAGPAELDEERRVQAASISGIMRITSKNAVLTPRAEN